MVVVRLMLVGAAMLWHGVVMVLVALLFLCVEGKVAALMTRMLVQH